MPSRRRPLLICFGRMSALRRFTRVQQSVSVRARVWGLLSPLLSRSMIVVFKMANPSEAAGGAWYDVA